MPTAFDPSPFVWLELDAKGNPVDAQAFERLGDALAEATDLVIISHGWKNDRRDATRLYGTLWSNARAHLEHPERIVVAGVLWPAKRYRTDFDEGALKAVTGGALAGEDATTTDLDDAEFDAAIAEAEEFLALAPGELEALARDAANAPEDHATALLAKLTCKKEAPTDAEVAEDLAALTDRDPAETLNLLTEAPVMMIAPQVGGTLSIMNTLSPIWNGPRAAVARLLNQFTYYEMKARAGVVGKALASQLDQLVPAQSPVRLHLVGHSFGARLVSATALHYAQRDAMPLHSMTLFQGAFSHNGFATKGAFRNVVDKPRGAISITHTHNDWAATILYPLASRLSRDTTSGFGDPADQFGALGANGALNLASTEYGSAPHSATTFEPEARKVNNFRADGYIVEIRNVTDAHNNITGAECGALLAATIQAE